MRPSLLPLIWKNIGDNGRHFDQFRLFEIGREIHPGGEAPHFAAAVFAKQDGAKDNGLAGLLELKRLAECLAPGAALRPSRNTQPYQHPHRSADVLLGDSTIGRLFEFHPSMVETGRAAVLDLDLALLENLQPPPGRYQPLRRFPASAFDLSVVAPAHSLVGDVQARLASHAGANLLSIVFLRDFALPDGQRSLSYRLTVGASDRTLSSEEVGAVRGRIIEGMREAGYDLKV
jgi:phenylalanyl-tRNA synthetase beta chain